MAFGAGITMRCVLAVPGKQAHISVTHVRSDLGTTALHFTEYCNRITEQLGNQ